MNKNISTIHIITLCICCISFYLLNLYTPLFSDDWHYHLIFNTDFPIKSFTDIIKSQYFHYFGYNGRVIPHFIIQSFAGLLGQNLFNICNTFTFLTYLLLISRLSVNKKEEYPQFIILCIFIILFFSNAFGETYLWMSGACNYLWVATTWLIFHHVLSLNIKNRLLYPLLFLLGLICGWTQEGIILGVGLGYFIYYLFNKSEITIARISQLLGLYLGIIFLILSPASFNRAINSGTFDISNILTYIDTIISLKNTYILFLSIISIVILKLLKRISLTSFIAKNIFYITSVIGLIVFIITIKAGSPRSHFGIEFFSLIIFMKTIPLYNIKKCIFNYLAFTSIFIFIPILYYANKNYNESISQIQQINKNCIIKTNEVKANEFIEKFLIKLYISESNDFYEGYSPNHYNNKFIAKAMQKDSILFLPEKFINQVYNTPELFHSFSMPSEFPFYAKEIKNKKIKSVEFILKPTNYKKLPFYIKPIAHKLQRYSLNYLETDKWEIISINKKRFIIVKKNDIIDNRLKDIICKQ